MSALCANKMELSPPMLDVLALYLYTSLNIQAFNLLQIAYSNNIFLHPPQAAFEPLGPEDGVVPHTPVLEGKQLPMGSQTIPSTPLDPTSSAVPQLAMTMQATGGMEKKMNVFMHPCCTGHYLTSEPKGVLIISSLPSHQ